MISITLTTDEAQTIRYALKELADRRQEQGIDRKNKFATQEAKDIRTLSARIVSEQQRQEARQRTPTNPVRTASDCIKQIEDAGWDIEHAADFHTNPTPYRATQRNFSTPWLESWEKVLAWIEGNRG